MCTTKKVLREKHKLETVKLILYRTSYRKNLTWTNPTKLAEVRPTSIGRVLNLLKVYYKVTNSNDGEGEKEENHEGIKYINIQTTTRYSYVFCEYLFIRVVKTLIKTVHLVGFWSSVVEGEVHWLKNWIFSGGVLRIFWLCFTPKHLCHTRNLSLWDGKQPTHWRSQREVEFLKVACQIIPNLFKHEYSMGDILKHQLSVSYFPQ